MRRGPVAFQDLNPNRLLKHAVSQSTRACSRIADWSQFQTAAVTKHPCRILVACSFSSPPEMTALANLRRQALATVPDDVSAFCRNLNGTRKAPLTPDQVAQPWSCFLSVRRTVAGKCFPDVRKAQRRACLRSIHCSL